MRIRVKQPLSPRHVPVMRDMTMRSPPRADLLALPSVVCVLVAVQPFMNPLHL